jgi:hypothetical protein
MVCRGCRVKQAIRIIETISQSLHELGLEADRDRTFMDPDNPTNSAMSDNSDLLRRLQTYCAMPNPQAGSTTRPRASAPRPVTPAGSNRGSYASRLGSQSQPSQPALIQLTPPAAPQPSFTLINDNARKAATTAAAARVDEVTANLLQANTLCQQQHETQQHDTAAALTKIAASSIDFNALEQKAADTSANVTQFINSQSMWNENKKRKIEDTIGKNLEDITALQSSIGKMKTDVAGMVTDALETVQAQIATIMQQMDQMTESPQRKILGPSSEAKRP